ncbi:MAG: flagellar basal body-associated FliL family protein [Campylobacterales bacterium]|nr:flagellar basal body-associated FliL family protein [Campylobacterales bacterium]
MADENQEATEEKKGGGKGLMIVLIVLIVLLIGAVGAMGYFMYSKGIFNPQDPQAAQAAQAAAQDPKATEKTQGKTTEEEGEKFYANVENLVLNVSDAKGRSKLMKLSFTIKSTEPTIAGQVDKNKPQITDAVIKQVSARSSEELLTVGGKAMLKDEMVEEINAIINENAGEEEIIKDSVKDIFFTSFVIK